MANFWSNLTLIVAVLWTTEEADIRQPPSIFKGPGNNIIFRSEMELVLPCKASGEPQPEYKWYVNGREVNVNAPNMKLSADPADGALTIDPIIVTNEGYYQCKARNPYGTSMSNGTRLQRASLLMIPETDIRKYPVTEGESLQIMCNPPTKSVPKPTFSWATVTGTVDASHKIYETNQRVQMTMDGHLLFAYVGQVDVHGDRLFQCNAFNAYTDTLAGGSYSQIIVRPNPNAPKKAPVLMYATEDGTIALLGGTLIMKCFFAGKPAATMNWKKLGGNSAIAPGRYDFQEDNTEVHIHDIRWRDEGAYECQGRNSAGYSRHQVHILVHSLPTFIQHPANTNATEDEEQVFTCTADGKPAPNIQWYINGEPLGKTNPGDRREISTDGTQLILRQLCKTCRDGSSDIMVVQCNASNLHGSVFSDAYLNVLERTRITKAPESLIIAVENATEATFDCEATSDYSTYIEIRWYLQRKRLYPDRDERLDILTKNGLYVDLSGLDEGGLRNYAGTYTCLATNHYSQDEASADLTFPNVDPFEQSGLHGGVIAAIIISILLIIALGVIALLVIRQYRESNTKLDTQKQNNPEINKSGLNPEKPQYEEINMQSGTQSNQKNVTAMETGEISSSVPPVVYENIKQKNVSKEPNQESITAMAAAEIPSPGQHVVYQNVRHTGASNEPNDSNLYESVPYVPPPEKVYTGLQISGNN